MTPSSPPRSVAIVGGGITGLATALALRKQAARPREISLFEAAPRLGGKILTLDFAGGRIEAGPDSFVAREPWVEDLCREVGLEQDLVTPDVFGATVWIGGKLRGFPESSVWGLPARPRAALRAEALTLTGRLRALADLILSGPLDGPDVSVRAFVTRRFGREVLDRLVDPLLAGTRAGSVDDMSLAAALPQIDALARSSRSVMRATGRQRTRPPRFLSLSGGMETLIDRLAHDLERHARIHRSTSIADIEKSGEGYELTTASGNRFEVDGVAVCLPAPAAADLLRDVVPGAAELLHDVEYAPVASVALRYPSTAFDPPVGSSGVLVPRSEGMTIAACTWWSKKWPGTSSEGLVVRCFVGRSPRDRIPTDDDGLIAACASDVATITGATSAPVEGAVTRWEDGLPQYRIGHLDRLKALDGRLGDHPRIALAGAGYRGSGLTDCVAQANEAARRLTGYSQPH